MDFIESQRALYPDLAQYYENFGDLHNRKLWHQLTMALESFLKNKSNHRGDNLYQLYVGFISKIEIRLNQVGLAQLVSTIGHSFNDASRSLEFFDSVLANRNRLGPEASMCLEMDVVLMKLVLGKTDETKALLEKAKEELPKISSTESVAFSKFYRATAEYRKLIGPPQEFYKAALMYLAYTQIDLLAVDEKYVLATDMALSAIAGDEVYNFGEVIETPILASLKDTPNEWLHSLVLALNHGDIDKFNLIIEQYKDMFFAQIALSSRFEFVKQKVILLCLMNMIFERHSHDRSIAFTDIASRTRIPIEQVEWVLMRAMALGLIKGTIDEVSSEVSVTWVQPRILDNTQLQILCEQLNTWTEKVKTALVLVEDNTPELYV